MKMPPPRATVWIVGATCAVWLVIVVLGLGVQAAVSAGFIPLRFADPAFDAAVQAQARASGFPNFFFLPVWITPLSAALVHVQFFHLFFNVAMIAFCGRFVEAGLGSRAFVLLYVLGALGAAAAQFVAALYVWPEMMGTPMIGASGAGSAVIAAYALLYGQPKAFTGRRRTDRAINVAWLAAAWIGLQLMIAFVGTELPVTIAVAAHIGGFLIGLLLARPLLLWHYRKA